MDRDAELLDLYREFGGRLYTYCLRVTASADDAADAVQETFTAVFARLSEGGPAIEHPRAYLYATARNACLRRIEDHRRARPVDEVPEAPPADERADAERDVLTRDLQEEVRAANAALPARQREVLVLHEVEGLSCEEIGRLMGLHANAVAQLAWRARVNLRGVLRRGALQSIAPVSEECERALTLLALAEDRSLDDDDRARVDDHLRSCDRCTANRTAMLEAGTTYRAWTPVAAAPIAAELLLEEAHAALRRTSTEGGERAAPRDGAASGDGPASSGGTTSGEATASRDGSAGPRRSPRGVFAALGVLLPALLVVAFWSADLDPPLVRVAATPASAPAPPTGPATTRAPSAAEPTRTKAAKRTATTAAPTPNAAPAADDEPQDEPAATTASEPRSTRDATPRRASRTKPRRTTRRSTPQAKPTPERSAPAPTTPTPPATTVPQIEVPEVPKVEVPTVPSEPAPEPTSTTPQPPPTTPQDPPRDPNPTRDPDPPRTPDRPCSAATCIQPGGRG